MANTFYAPGEQRVERVKALFARVASRYDLMNDLQSFGLHRYWKDRMVTLGTPKPGWTGLDVCCGTADLSLVLARRGALVVGLDFSQEMLGVGMKRKAKGQMLKAKGTLEEERQEYETQQKKARHGSAGSLDFVQGEARRLPCSENTFDIVSFGYGLRKLADWAAGLKEMYG